MVNLGGGLRDPTGPQPVHEHSKAIGAAGRLVDSSDVEQHAARIAPWLRRCPGAPGVAPEEGPLESRCLAQSLMNHTGRPKNPFGVKNQGLSMFNTYFQLVMSMPLVSVQLIPKDQHSIPCQILAPHPSEPTLGQEILAPCLPPAPKLLYL